ncbi:hypothetical protein HK105_203588 [Polyrhizophydium stewartii]|uniref:High-temperature-induced dauer-formation protein n=1 Tax=Polyrhizophydium stewartii TaxID=2732419 RepID=A0ABR4NBA4_9FUNG
MGAAESKLSFRKNVFALYEQQASRAMRAERADSARTTRGRTRAVLDILPPNPARAPAVGMDGRTDGQAIPPENHGFWDSFLQLPDSAEDVFNLVSPKDIRKIIQDRPENIETLIQKAAARILGFVQISSTPALDGFRDVLNAVRILTRTLPFVFELEDGGALETKIFWSNDIQDASSSAAAESAEAPIPTLGSRLALAVVQLLFFKRFTISESVGGNENVQYAIWQRGVGANVAIAPSKDESIRRTEVLRLLLTLLSRTLYVKPSSLIATDNPWARIITTRLGKKPVLALLCSLINTIVSYDPIGWAALPYNHASFFAANSMPSIISGAADSSPLASQLLFGDITEALVTVCIQTLTVLLDYKSWEAPSSARVRKASTRPSLADPATQDQAEAATDTPASTTMSGTANDFRYYMGKLHRPADFSIIASGITRLLRNPLDAGKAYLPGSTKKVALTSELVALLWTLINTNEGFLRHVVELPHVLVIIEALLSVCLEVRRDPSRAGALRLACFTLHILSQERGFGIALNEPFDMSSVGSLSKHFPIFSSGCWADFLFLSIYVILSTTGPTRPVILTLQEPLMVVLTNASPLVKSMTATTANKMISLFDVFSSPAFLLSKEHNFRLLFYLLDMFNNIVQYQFAGNAQLIYSIVRHKERIVQLSSLTLEKAIAEVERMRTLDAQRRAGLSRAGSTASAAPAESAKDSAVPPWRESRDKQSAPAESEQAGDQPAPTALSEKARGKLPERESESLRSSGVQSTTPGAGLVASPDAKIAEAADVASPNATAPAEFQSKSGFRPTEEWFNFWRSQLQLFVILQLVDYLGPRIEQFCIENGLNDDRRVVEFLSKETVVGVLPQPHPIVMRRFTYTDSMHVWFTSYFWGTVYLKGTEASDAETAKLCPPIWLGTGIQLFQVRTTPAK